MAQPKSVSSGYTKITNELQDTFIKFRLTKRQRNILDLIIRLSYGCQREFAFIPALKHFSPFGVSKQDIKKELEKLEAARVITWNRDRCFFALNKNFDEWQLEHESLYNEQLLKDLIALQLYSNPKLNATRKKGINLEKEVRKKRTNIIRGSQKANSLVRKKRTFKFVEYEPQKPANYCQDCAGRLSKDNIKNNIKNNNSLNNTAAKNNTIEQEMQEEINKVYEFFEKNIKPQGMTPYHYERINDWLDDHSPEFLLHVFKHALDSTRSNGSSPLVFIDRILLRARQKGIKTVEQFVAAEKQREAERQTPRQEKRSTRTEMLPDWFHKLKEEERQEKEQQRKEEEEKRLQQQADQLKAEIEAEEVEKKRRELEERIKNRRVKQTQQQKEATQ